MSIDFLKERMSTGSRKDAVIWKGQTYSYGWLLDALDQWKKRLARESLPAGLVVSLEADFSPNAIALMLALLENGCIIVPLTASVETKKPEFQRIAEVEVVIGIGNNDEVHIGRTGIVAGHELLLWLRKNGRPGLVLFSSGSSGKSKAAVHDFVPLLEQFRAPRRSYRSIAFLLFDHIGGINTLLHTLSNTGCIITVSNRSPDGICEAIERHKAQLLPTSPTFINLLLLSEAYKRYDLSSLDIVSYGTEVMPASTLNRFHNLFPRVRLQQTYGLSEIGIMQTKSKSSDSLWMKMGGEGFETRIADGMLEIRAASAMLGYLNYPSPFTEDGWFKTGDAVEVDGDFFRIPGRKSEMINVGGEKVYPAEVENILQTMEGVEDVVVTGESNPILGQIVKAKVKISTGESSHEFRRRMNFFCRDKLQKYKIPQKVIFMTEDSHGERFKKMRREPVTGSQTD